MSAIDYDGLGRWGFKWKGNDHGTHVPMADGYWTPWHEAATAITALRGEVEASDKDRTELQALCDKQASELAKRRAENERMKALLFEIGNACALADKAEELSDYVSGDLYSRCIQAGFPTAALAGEG